MKTQKSASCFTLIELLVVIAIIAILAAILLPALNKARERGVQTDCMSRQKNIGTAINMYRGEYNDMLVSQNAKTGVGSSSADANWISRLMLCKYISNGTNHQDASIYMCPMTEGQIGTPNIERGYGIMTYVPYHVWSKRFYAIDFKPAGVQKVGESKVLIVADSGWHDGSAPGIGCSLIAPAKAASYGLPYARHNGTLNGLLLDGHVESVTGEEMNEKFRWIRYTWSSGPPKWSLSKAPHFITGPYRQVTLKTIGSTTSEYEQNI